MRRTAALVAALAASLALLPLAAANDSTPLEATFQWRSAHGYGENTFTGRTWAIQMASQDPGEYGAPAGSSLRVMGERIEVVRTYRDYVATPAALAPADPTTLVTTDGSSFQTERIDVGRGSLILREVREDVRLMVIPLAAEGPAPLGEISTSIADLSAAGMADVAFGGPPQVEEPELNPRFHHDGPVLAAATGDQPKPTMVRGDFVVHLWEIDVASGSSPDDVFRSGVLRQDGTAATEQTPNGMFYEARFQMLSLRVSQGELSFQFPDRPLHAFLEPRATSLSAHGSWDVDDALGRLAFGQSERSFVASHLHLDGTFEVAFDLLGDDAAVRSLWSGGAHHVTVDRSSLEPGMHSASVAAGPAPWMLGSFVAGGLAVAGLSTAGALRWGQKHPRDLKLEDVERLLVEDAPAPPPAVDGPVAQGIADLKAGQPQRVIDAFDAEWSAQNPSAAIEAYLLSLAHVQLGHKGPAVDWLVIAIQLYPEFASQLDDNPAFGPIKDDPRLCTAPSGAEEVSGYA